MWLVEYASETCQYPIPSEHVAHTERSRSVGQLPSPQFPAGVKEPGFFKPIFQVSRPRWNWQLLLSAQVIHVSIGSNTHLEQSHSFRAPKCSSFVWNIPDRKYVVSQVAIVALVDIA
jgi:hypothetical protein